MLGLLGLFSGDISAGMDVCTGVDGGAGGGGVTGLIIPTGSMNTGRIGELAILKERKKEFNE